MAGEILDGKIISQQFAEQLRAEVDNSHEKPKLALINVFGDAASEVYLRNKRRLAEKIGVISEMYTLDADICADSLCNVISSVNNDTSVHGIILQLPIPRHLGSEDRFLNMISPEKDVDGLTLINQGRLFCGQHGLRPCTPMGVLHLLKKAHDSLDGLRVVVLGRSAIVGRPLAMLLIQNNATVTVLHSRSRDIKDRCAEADVVVSAVGQAWFISDDTWIKEGATVIDVGISRLPDGKIVGDVNFDAVRHKCAYITPVPGGVGPMTVAYLMHNTIQACHLQSSYCVTR